MASFVDRLNNLKQQVEAAKERLNYLRQRGTSREQETILLRFLERDYELGCAAYFTAQNGLEVGFFHFDAGNLRRLVLGLLDFTL